MSYLWGIAVSPKGATIRPLQEPRIKSKPIGYQMSSHNEPKTTGTHKKSEAENSHEGLSEEEKKIIELLEWSKGRKLSPEEVHLSLEQARHIGEL
jgi:hypothetical protein